MADPKERFSKSRLLQQGIKFDDWQEPDLRIFSEELKQKIGCRVSALKAFLLKGASCEEIQNRYGVAKSSLYLMIDRACQPDQDGEYIGYRAAILQLRVKSNEYRIGFTNEQDQERTNGEAGIFSNLLRSYPELDSLICRYASLYKSRKEGGAKRLVDFHGGFLKQCEELGIHAPQYPFTSDDRALRSFSRHLHGKAKEIAQKKRARDRHVEDLAILPPIEPLQQIELDGHNIDLRLTVKEVDTFGLTCLSEILTLWVILVIDVFSRCVLGYSLALGKNYDQTDLLTAVYNSLAPHKKPPAVVPGLTYKVQGGFPSDKNPELAWSCGLIYKLDNAMSHKAKDVEAKLREIVCSIDDFGPPHQPNERAVVETFFRYLVDNFSHRLVGTTGARPNDEIIKRLAPKGGDLSLLLTMGELHHALDVVISDYNGRPHTGITPHSPLELFLRSVAERDLIFPKLLPENRDIRKFTCRTAIVTVHQDGPQSAFINFKGARYRNLPVLSFSVDGEVMIEWDPMNISYLRVYDLKGGYLGEVFPPSLWSGPHSEKLRLRLQRSLKTGQIAYREGDSIPDLLHSLQASEGWKDREVVTYNIKHLGGELSPKNSNQPVRPIVKPVERLTVGYILKGDKR
ncbi:Mu transposase C-terminal domain-containing protein [Pseudomonas sp. P867]|uniref:Mu transposase C-terminal domain-containing protein n=1 Tax=Pseudomonas sp. P867 TaxID=2816050 RepID=UPI001CA6217B|nr:Mu transposase C-terminal domain-containing protein [Pseudomonas sp. P867]MBY8972729.1 Mu transposase C-terminal domain-containing protein [Pseudomonas sp. P867]